MTTILFYLLQALALILLVMGYRSKKRMLLLAAAICIWAGYGIEDFAEGFADGYNEASVRGA